jgi:hypothetical protein
MLVVPIRQAHACIASKLAPRPVLTYATNFYWHAETEWLVELVQAAASKPRVETFFSTGRAAVRCAAAAGLRPSSAGHVAPAMISPRCVVAIQVTGMFVIKQNMCLINGVQPRHRRKPARTRMNFLSAASCH